MRPFGPESARLVALGGAALVIAIPVVLVVATREPLESPPHRGRPAIVDDAGDRGAVQTRESQPRKERRQAREATPLPAPSSD